MNVAIDAVLDSVNRLRRSLKAGGGKQIWSDGERNSIRGVCGEYFGARSGLGETEDAVDADGVFKELHEMSRGNPSRAKVVDMLTDARRLLVRLEGSALTSATAKAAGRKTATDQHIIETLKELCPTAAAAYSQALADLNSEKRESWRGPATDLRESLRETLDVLAPDEDVKKSPGFKPEKDTHRPTMKQKVRHILKSRGVASGAMSAPESAVEGIEEIVGSLMRSVYTRTSVSSHTATDKKEVVRVHAWVRLVFCDLLEIPPE
jgi:hypothetical protein